MVDRYESNPKINFVISDRAPKDPVQSEREPCPKPQKKRTQKVGSTTEARSLIKSTPKNFLKRTV